MRQCSVESREIICLQTMLKNYHHKNIMKLHCYFLSFGSILQCIYAPATHASFVTVWLFHTSSSHPRHTSRQNDFPEMFVSKKFILTNPRQHYEA